MAREDEQFVRDHEGFVRGIAMRVKGELDLTCDLGDLIAFGFHGLLEAKQRFDPNRGVQFNTFAYYRVRGAVIDGVRKMAYLPRRAHQLRKVAEAADAMLEQEGEARAASPEARGDVQATVQQIDSILGKLTASFIIAAVGQDETSAPVAPDEALIRATECERVRGAVQKLPERELKIVREMYFEGRVLDDIAADLGISKSWASRIHTKALGMMREALEAEG